MQRLWLGLLVGLMLLPATLVRAELKPDSSVEDILNALDARGQNLTSFTAVVKLTDVDTGLGDSTSRTGKVLFQAGDSASLRVTFDKRQSGNKVFDEKIEYLLAGPDLIDRNYQTKSQITRHVLKPGEKMNLLRLGEGPFPLPIGQKAEDVHKMFEVTKVAAKPDDPANTVRLELIPKAGTRFEQKFKSINVWVDLKENMPVRIATLDPNDTTLRTTDLSAVQVNPTLTAADFTLPSIDRNEWNVSEEAFNGN